MELKIGMLALNFHVFIMVLVVVLLVISIIKILLPVSITIGLTDKPGGRKKHASPTPIIGGIAMFLGLCVTVLIFSFPLTDYRGFFAGSALLVFFGVLDDLHELSARQKLLAQLGAAFMMCFWGHHVIASLGALWAEGLVLHSLAIPFTVLCTIASINAVNMIDGFDGLSGSLIFSQLLMFLGVSVYCDKTQDIILLLMLISAIMGFLGFNFPFKNRAARIFMGDAGSMFWGFVMVWFAITVSQYDKHINPITVVWIIALPMFDMIRLFIERIKNKKSPFKPDRRHLHHLLEKYIKNKSLLCLCISLLSFSLGGVGFILEYFDISQQLNLALYVFIFSLYFVGVRSGFAFLTASLTFETAEMGVR